jgi:hypothetical protein
MFVGDRAAKSKAKQKKAAKVEPLDAKKAVN